MRRRTGTWVWILVLSVSAIIGSIIGEMLQGLAPILAKGFSVGLTPPFTLDLKVISLTFGFTLRLNLLGAIFVLLMVLIMGR